MVTPSGLMTPCKFLALMISGTVRAASTVTIVPLSNTITFVMPTRRASYMYLNTAFFFFSLLQFYHDKLVVEAYMSRIDADQRDELIVSEFEVGVSRVQMDDINFKVSRVRQIRDILNNSVRDLYKVDDTVTQWVDSLGGYRKIQEQILGLSLSSRSWYHRVCKELEDVLGGVPAALGLPSADIHVDTATSNDSYSVQVHRELANQQAFGEYHDLDDISTPNWALSDQDFDIQRSEYDGLPYWWKYISMGRFRVGKEIKNLPKTKVTKQRWVEAKEYDVYNVYDPEKFIETRVMEGHFETYEEEVPMLRQNETSSGPLWVPDIRLSAVSEDGGWDETPFKHITAVAKWYLMQEHTTVKEFIHRFYNQPKRLFWKKVGYGEKTRWACGMLTPKGQYIWSPVSYPSSKKMDWYFENEGKSWTPKKRRAIYVRDNHGDWVIQFGKQGDKIRVIKMKQNEATGLFEIWKEIDMEWQEWGKLKKQLIKMGGRDAYLGYPDTPYKAPQQYVTDIQI